MEVIVPYNDVAAPACVVEDSLPSLAGYDIDDKTDINKKSTTVSGILSEQTNLTNGVTVVVASTEHPVEEEQATVVRLPEEEAVKSESREEEEATIVKETEVMLTGKEITSSTEEKELNNEWEPAESSTGAVEATELPLPEKKESKEVEATIVEEAEAKTKILHLADKSVNEGEEIKSTDESMDIPQFVEEEGLALEETEEPKESEVIEEQEEDATIVEQMDTVPKKQSLAANKVQDAPSTVDETETTQHLAEKPANETEKAELKDKITEVTGSEDGTSNVDRLPEKVEESAIGEDNATTIVEEIKVMATDQSLNEKLVNEVKEVESTNQATEVPVAKEEGLLEQIETLPKKSEESKKETTFVEETEAISSEQKSAEKSGNEVEEAESKELSSEVAVSKEKVITNVFPEESSAKPTLSEKPMPETEESETTDEATDLPLTEEEEEEDPFEVMRLPQAEESEAKEEDEEEGSTADRDLELTRSEESSTGQPVDESDEAELADESGQQAVNDERRIAADDEKPRISEATWLSENTKMVDETTDLLEEPSYNSDDYDYFDMEERTTMRSSYVSSGVTIRESCVSIGTTIFDSERSFEDLLSPRESDSGVDTVSFTDPSQKRDSLLDGGNTVDFNNTVERKSITVSSNNYSSNTNNKNTPYKVRKSIRKSIRKSMIRKSKIISGQGFTFWQRNHKKRGGKEEKQKVQRMIQTMEAESMGLSLDALESKLHFERTEDQDNEEMTFWEIWGR